MNEIKMGSLFDGSAGFPLAGIMWGNGVALPCVLYVMEGIAMKMSKGGDAND